MTLPRDPIQERPRSSRAVSIIIPAKNEGRHLPTLLKSLAHLDYPADRIEVIVVDNGSIDRTRDIAEAFGATVLRDDTLSVAGLRNVGARVATGDILAFVDADCVVSSDWLARAVPYAERREIAAWGAPPLPPEEATWVQRAWYAVRRKEKDVQEVDWLESMNLFVRKEHFLKAKGFNEALVTCEDVDFCYRMRAFGTIWADISLKVVHHGEARTLREFVKKEVWRGQSNLQGVFSHRLSIKEIPSLAIPFYYGVFIPGLGLAAVLAGSLTWLGTVLFACLLPLGAALYRLRHKKIDLSTTLQLLMLLQVYFVSRTIAIATVIRHRSCKSDPLGRGD